MATLQRGVSVSLPGDYRAEQFERGFHPSASGELSFDSPTRCPTQLPLSSHSACHSE
jgi:hypothetical protein